LVDGFDRGIRQLTVGLNIKQSTTHYKFCSHNQNGLCYLCTLGNTCLHKRGKPPLRRHVLAR